jgi:ribosomal protein S18 acetylase RimI-like enzyme
MNTVGAVRFWEEAYANAWPSFEQLLYDGWLLRFTPGYSKNNNSVWPLYDGAMPLERNIAFCELQYAARELNCNFRLSEIPGHEVIEERLTRRGYVEHNPNLVMVRPSTNGPEVEITDLLLDDWLELIYRIHPVDDPAIIDWERQVLKRLTLPGHYAVVKRKGKACGYGRSVRQGKILLIENLWTLPELRGQGLGTRLIQGLLQLGQRDGAEIASLTVNESNAGARRLYERLGFENGYRYRYLVPKE